MSVLLILAILVALFGFVLLLTPQPVWKLVQKEKELTGALEAFLRLAGIGCLALSVLIAQLV